MKKPLFTAAILSALVAYGAPVTSHAADLTLFNRGNGYAVFVGQGTDCPQQTIKDIYELLESGGILCPEIPSAPAQPDSQLPDAETPDVPAQPDSQLPGAETPDIPAQPDGQLPGAETPDVPAQPDGQLSDAETPDVPAQPGDQLLDAETPSADAFHPYAVQILNLVNAERTKAGLSELKLDESITAAANVRAKEIKTSFSHTRPDGTGFGSALTEQGISYRRSGENIAWGQKTPEQVMNGWMNSDGHRANILNPDFENIGIGYYQDDSGVNYWVQLFTS